MEKLYVSYKDVHVIVDNLSDKIFDKFEAEVIIGIGGGGLLPARLFRTTLGIPMYAVFISFYEDNAEDSKERPQITQWLDGTALDFVRGKRILIVDEVNDSGATLQYCVEQVLKTCEPKELAVAILHDKKREKTGIIDTNSVQYFVGEEVEDRWVVYPWSNIDMEETDEEESEETEETDDDDGSITHSVTVTFCALF